MNLVSWNSAIQIKKKPHREHVREEGKLWSEIIDPVNHNDLVGNEQAVQKTEDWFREASENPEASSCLFVHGESGTGKSTAVSMIARKFNFKTVTTYADQSRTPARLEGVVREAGVYGSRGVVVLDDFEIFLSETTSLRVLSKLLRQLLGAGDRSEPPSRCLFIIISNSTHKLFGALQDVSTKVCFQRLQQKEIYKIFNRLATRVRNHSYIPPMATYLSSISSSGTITQGVQQLQLVYAGNTKPHAITHRPKRAKTSAAGADASNLGGHTTKNNRDCISYLWSDTYTDRILQHLVDENFQRMRVIDRLVEFERGRLDVVGGQLHDEYARRMTSVEQLRNVAEAISMSDTNRAEVHQDALFDGENQAFWSANDISYVSFVAYGVVAIKGQKRRDQYWSRKPHTRLLKCHPFIF